MSGPVRITHPFHPLFGQQIDFVSRYRQWGEDHIHYRGSDGHLSWIPTRWTSAEPEDTFAVVSAGRSYFRVTDLIDLAALIRELHPEKGPDHV